MRARTWAWLVVVVVYCCAAWLTLPWRREPLPFFMDDWDFAGELLRLSPVQYLFAPQGSGHVFPFFKAIYGALMLALDFDAQGLRLMQFVCRWTMLFMWLAMLRRAGKLDPFTGLCLVPLVANEVGILDTYLWGVELCHEMALLTAVGLLYAVYRFVFLQTGRSSTIALWCIAGCWSFSVGLVMPIAAFLSLLVFRPGKGTETRAVKARTAILAGFAIGLSAFLYSAGSPETLALRIPPSDAAGQILTAFYVGSLLNPGLSGLRVATTPGLANVAYLVVLVCGVAVLTLRRRSQPETFLVLASLMASIGVGVLIAATRAGSGPIYASSYRYNLNHIAFEAPVVAVLVATTSMPMRAVVALIAAGLALAGTARGGPGFDVIARERSRCVQDIIRSTTPAPACLSTVYHRSDPERLRWVAHALEGHGPFKVKE